MTKTTKIVLIIVAAIVVVGGVIGGIFGYKAYQDKKEQEALVAYLKEVDMARQTAINNYNERINQAMAFDLNATEDMNVLNGAITNLNAIITDVSNDVIIPDEQKADLNAKASEQVNAINARIGAINEAKAKAEAKAKEEQAKKASAKTNNSGNAIASNSSNNSSAAPRVKTWREKTNAEMTTEDWRQKAIDEGTLTSSEEQVALYGW